MYKKYAAKFILTYDAFAPFVTFSILIQQKPCSVQWQPNVYARKTSEGSKRSSKTNFSMSQTKSHFTPSHVSALAAQRIQCPHRIQTLSYLSFFFLGLFPIYSSALLSVYTPKGHLRSSSDNIILCIPNLRTWTFGHHSFSFAVPTI